MFHKKETKGYFVRGWVQFYSQATQNFTPQHVTRLLVNVIAQNSSQKRIESADRNISSKLSDQKNLIFLMDQIQEKPKKPEKEKQYYRYLL